MIQELLSFGGPPRLVEDCGRPLDVLVTNFASNMSKIDCHPAPIFIDLSNETCDHKWRWEQIYPRSKSSLPLPPPPLLPACLPACLTFAILPCSPLLQPDCGPHCDPLRLVLEIADGNYVRIDHPCPPVPHGSATSYLVVPNHPAQGRSAASATSVMPGAARHRAISVLFPLHPTFLLLFATAYLLHHCRCLRCLGCRLTV